MSSQRFLMHQSNRTHVNTHYKSLTRREIYTHTDSLHSWVISCCREVCENNSAGQRGAVISVVAPSGVRMWDLRLDMNVALLLWYTAWYIVFVSLSLWRGSFTVCMGSNREFRDLLCQNIFYQHLAHTFVGRQTELWNQCNSPIAHFNKM